MCNVISGVGWIGWSGFRSRGEIGVAAYVARQRALMSWQLIAIKRQSWNRLR